MVPEVIKARLRGLRGKLYALLTLEGLARLLVILGILIVYDTNLWVHILMF